MSVILNYIRLAGCSLCLLMLLMVTITCYAESPLTVDGARDFYQRVLSLPGAHIYKQADISSSIVLKDVPAFTVFYVYEQKKVSGKEWLRVSDAIHWDSNTAAKQWRGWVEKEGKTEEWKSTLVLQFAAKGQRKRVLFFKDKKDLKGLFKSRLVAKQAEKYYQQIEDGEPDRRALVAVEPDTSIAKDNTYLLPILDWKKNVRFKDGQATTLVEVASLNDQKRTKEPTVIDEGLGSIAPEMTDVNVGIVFVVDTTASMGVYINQIKDVVHHVYSKLSHTKFANKMHYGLVAYRDNMDGKSGIKYVTKIFQPLDINTTADSVLKNLQAIAPSTASTEGWDEDAYAGLHDALKQDWWNGFSAKFIVLVSDAGARPENDAMVKYPGFGLLSIKELARVKKVSIFPFYMKTKLAQRLGNPQSAERQYRQIGANGDPDLNRLFSVEAGDPVKFRADMDDFSYEIVDALEEWSGGMRQKTTSSRPKKKTKASRVSKIIRNELARVELDYLGNERGQAAPPFYRAWAADKDLTNSKLSMFDIKIMLTRNQLSDLAMRVQALFDQMKLSAVSAKDFLTQLQGLAATMSMDPTKGTGNTHSISMVLPEYLRKLPYESDVLRMSAEDWMDKSVTQQQGVIDKLADKLSAYREIEKNAGAWVSMSKPNHAGRDFALVPIELLP